MTDMTDITLRVAEDEVSITESFIRRFWAKVDKSSEGCWEWTGYRDKKGYGHTRLGPKMVLVHRVSYRLHHEDLDPVVFVDHKCHNSGCVRPEHLHAVNNQLNTENRRGANSGSRSGIRGVHWHSANKKWVVKICVHGHDHYLGIFSDLATAEKVAVQGRIRLMSNNLTDFEEWKKYLKENS